MQKKILEDKPSQTRVEDKQKTERATHLGPRKPVDRPVRFIAPFRLELAGNRLSPLHEW